MDLEGSEVLEKLAEIGKVEAFYQAVDADDFGKITSLLKKAGVDSKTISQVIEQIQNGD